MDTNDRTEQFVHLVTQYQLRVQMFILSLVPNRADAEEILQETNLVLWRKFDEFQPGTDFRAWAFQVAYNKVRSFRERHGRDRLRFGEEVADRLAELAATSPACCSMELDILNRCKQRLNPRDFDLIERRYQPGATAESVANDVGRSVTAVYKAVVRIRRALYQCVQRALQREERA